MGDIRRRSVVPLCTPIIFTRRREDAKGKPGIQVVERLSQSFLAPGDEQLGTTTLQCGPIVARQSLVVKGCAIAGL